MLKHTDLETELDAAFKRADKKKRKLSSLGELKEVSTLKPKIEKAAFNFTYHQYCLMRFALLKYVIFLRDTNAPEDMFDCALELEWDVVDCTLTSKEGRISAITLDVNQFHIIATALAAYDEPHELTRGLLDFFRDGKPMS